MEITPGRAPFSEEEDYTPLRKPKSAVANNTPTAVYGGGNGSDGVGASTSSFNSNAMGSLGVDTSYGGRTVSPSKLSPYAKEFVPRFGGTSGVSGSAADAGGATANYQNIQGQQQQRYANGYQSSQLQQQAQYGQQITSLTASVQERLKIAGASASASASGSSGNTASTSGHKSNNYYQQQPHHHSHNQSRYNKHQQQQQRHHNQNHHHHHNHHNNNKQNNHHHHHHHNNHHQHGSSSNSGGSGNAAAGSASDMETIALEYLQTVIQCLNQNPGQFDTIATRFLTIFDGMENNQYVLSVAMEDIFQESIQNPNFRYMGAKLYNLLHMLNLKKDSLFHTLLKCKLDYHQQEVVQYMQINQQQKVRETALFLAELYMQLRGDDSRIHLIAENIVYSLKQLLSKESADNVRCICLTLKLAGYDLTADCPDEMKEIIAALETINQQSPGKYPLAANVISLQKNNWGRKVSSNSLSDVSEDAVGGGKVPELRLSDEPVFYGPDGRELTAEEADFLAGGTAGDGNAEDSDKDDDVDVDEMGEFDPEMDEETEKDYKEFCKLNAST